ncbi:MAG: TraR/DksA C4-type zinc finger protein [Ginsengibacter sp.]
MAKQKQKSIPASKKPAAAKKNAAQGKKASASALKKPVKKAAPKKPVANKPVAKKKSAAKKAAPVKKQAAPKKSPAKKAAKPILKPAPAKKAAKPVAKKAAPKNLANIKKISVSKSTGKEKKASVPVSKKIMDAPVKQVKPVDKSASLNGGGHLQKLKTAVAKTSGKGHESKKAQKPFVMPKTTTEKARKYEPQFVKSVLDQVPEENNGPSMRYSDNELVEFRDLITRKLETAKKELGYLQGLITRKDEMGGDDTDNRYMTMEDGSLSMEREQLSQMASRQITFIDHLEKAMMRIENKTYGICRVTGKLIDKARLRAVPHATLSIEAKMGISK